MVPPAGIDDIIKLLFSFNFKVDIGFGTVLDTVYFFLYKAWKILGLVQTIAEQRFVSVLAPVAAAKLASRP